MKKLFIPVKSKAKANSKKILKLSEKLPKNIAIAYSIQYQDIAFEIKKILKHKNITAFIQVLGCSVPTFSSKTNAVLLIGSGKFHGISLALNTKLPVYVLNSNTLEIISKQDIEKIQKKQRASYLRYLTSNKVGLLISIKPGQNRLQRALDFKKKLKNKKAYLFLSNNINSQELENFKIDSWINTACPRLDFDSSAIVNMSMLNLSNREQ